MVLNLKDIEIDHPNIKLFLDETFNKSNRVKVSKFLVEPNFETPIDVHDVAELWCVLKGYGEIEIKENKHFLKEGDIQYIPPKTKHKIKNFSKEDLVIFSIWWNIDKI